MTNDELKTMLTIAKAAIDEMIKVLEPDPTFMDEMNNRDMIILGPQANKTCRKLPTIKLWRNLYNGSLRDGKLAVEEWMDANNVKQEDSY